MFSNFGYLNLWVEAPLILKHMSFKLLKALCWGGTKIRGFKGDAVCWSPNRMRHFGGSKDRGAFGNKIGLHNVPVTRGYTQHKDKTSAGLISISRAGILASGINGGTCSRRITSNQQRGRPERAMGSSR
eukprot:6267099-Karenia_brevis.AAC.1